MEAVGTSSADAGHGRRPASERLTSDIVRHVEGIGALKADYEHLERVTGNTLPFALQEWHLAWCRQFLGRNPQIEEYPLFHVLRRDDGECVAIVPLILARRRLGPLGFTIVELIGADAGLTEIRNPLVKPGYEQPTVRAVLASLARVGDWDWTQWSGISGALAQALAREASPRWEARCADFVLDLPGSWAEFRHGLARNIRESLRHCYNSLKRDGRAFEFVVAREPAEVAQALDRFLVLHAQRARAASGPPHPDRFAHRSAQAFLRDVCSSLAARGAVRVFQLKIAAEIVASRIGFIVGDGIYMYYSGFDPAWARYSVMTTTVAEALRYAIANGLRTFNLSVTPEQSKLRWHPRRVDYHCALLPREPLTSRLLCGAYRVSHAHQGAAAQLVKGLLWARRDCN